jgi:hypothetical protein
MSDDDGAATLRVNWPVAAAVVVTFIARGFGVQVTPAGSAAAGQVTFTVPVNPPLGVTVMVEVPLEPAGAIGTALPLIVKVPPEAFTVKLTLLEVPPPGAGFVTVTAFVPAVAMSDARMAAVSWVALTKVVVFAAPAKLTVEELTKPVPFTVRVNACPPAVALGGISVVIVGIGLPESVPVKEKFKILLPPKAMGLGSA